jgi:DNA polymerase-3 subunit delta'
MNPNENQFRFVIVNPPESQYDRRAKFLLKTIEEPNENIVILLMAITTDSLLPTVISRVQTFEYYKMMTSLVEPQVRNISKT